MRVASLFTLLLCTTTASVGCGDDGDESSGSEPTSPSEQRGASPEPGSLHARFAGDWKGELTGEAAERLERAELVVQDESPSAEQLAELSDEERSKLEKKRSKLATSPADQAKAAETMLQQMKSVFEDMELHAGADELTFRMGQGRKERRAHYEVLEEKGNELRIRSRGTSGGSPQERTLVFEGEDAFRMRMDLPGGRRATLRFTRQ